MDLLLDSHAAFWWVQEPAEISPAATEAVEEAESIAVSAITWFELSLAAVRGRLQIEHPVRAWISETARRFTTISPTPIMCAVAAELPPSVPADPFDRLIVATAIESGRPLVTKDRALRSAFVPGLKTIW